MGQVIKGGTAGEPLGLVDFEAEARAVVEQARAQARAIVASATEQARLLAEQASRDAAAARLEARRAGSDEGRKDGYAKGLAEGREKGNAEATKKVTDAASTVGNTLVALVNDLEARRHALLEECRREVLRLAMRVAERVVRREVNLDPGLIERTVMRAVELTAQKTDIEIRVNPADLDAVQRFLPELARKFAGLAVGRVHPDEAVSRGGCVLRSSEGTVDADIATQMEELEKLLLG